MGIDRQQWTARGPGPTGLRARIEAVADLVEPVEVPLPAEVAEPVEADAEQADGAVEPDDEQTVVVVPRWRTNPAVFGPRRAGVDEPPAADDADGDEVPGTA